MLSDSCFDFCLTLDRGCKVRHVYAAIAALRADVEDFKSSGDYEREVLQDLDAACCAAFSGGILEWAALAHRAITVTQRYDAGADDPFADCSWKQFKTMVDAKPMYELRYVNKIRRRNRITTGDGGVTRGFEDTAPCDKFIAAHFNKEWIAELRNQVTGAGTLSGKRPRSGQARRNACA